MTTRLIANLVFRCHHRIRLKSAHTLASHAALIHRTLLTSPPNLNTFQVPIQGDIVEPIRKSPEDESQTKEIVQKVNKQIIENDHGRLFAIVHVAGHQHKVTSEDIIVVVKHMELDIGERIRLDKVLLVGGSDFTLVGRPLLSKELVRVEATVLEKTLSHLKSHFTFIKRRRHRRMRLFKTLYTLLRINSIEVVGLVNELPQVEGVKNTLF